MVLSDSFADYFSIFEPCSKHSNLGRKKLINKIKISFVIFLTGLFFSGIYAQIVPKNESAGEPRRMPVQEKPFIRAQDSVKSQEKDSLKRNENVEGLEYPLYKSAEKYQLIDRKNKKLYLYDKAHIKYHDIDLQAGRIVVDYEKKQVFAGPIPDSTGQSVQRPVFKQGQTETESDSILFNFETKRALVWNTFTRDGEISLISKVTKKVNDSVSFFSDLKITTAEDIENPEYYILAKRGKIVPGKKIVVGSSQMYIEEIPTPFVLPFGYFPLIQQRTSGFILPNYGEDQRGFFLQNLGFYLVLSQYADLALLTDIYTNGSFGVQLRNNYKKRYSFLGNLQFRMEKIVQGEYGAPDYSRRNMWNITWTHSKDPKSNPAYNFSANVNLGSSKYYRYSYNQQNLPHVLNNTMNSSVNFSTRFRSVPLSLNISALHNQNVNTEQINLTLPQLYIKLDRIYPFAPKSGLKKNLIHKLNFDYTVDAQNRITTHDSLFFKKEMWKDALWGMRHRIPLSTQFKLLKYINVTPSASFSFVTYGQQLQKYWDPNLNNGNGAVVDTILKKPASFYEYNFSAGMSTVIYGIFRFGDKHKWKGIRHIIRPSVSYQYTPGLKQYQSRYQASSDPTDWREYTIFDGGMYGAPHFNVASSMSLNLSNTFEAKIEGPDGKDKKIDLIKNLNLSTMYNFKADSMKLGYINMVGSIEPVKGLNIRVTGNLDPYAVDENGRNYDTWAFKAGQPWLHLRRLQLSTGYVFNNSLIKKIFGAGDKPQINKEFKGEKEEEDQAYRNPIKWNLNVSYTLTYNNRIYHPLQNSFLAYSPHTLNFNGSIEFSPGWKMNFNSGYDLVKKDLTYTVLSFTRDLKSWFMTFTWRPLPPYTSWYFYIGIKASVFRDIKYERRKESFNRFF